MRSRIVFLDNTSNLMVVHTLQLPDTQRKLLKTSGHSLMRRNVDSFVAVNSTIHIETPGNGCLF